MDRNQSHNCPQSQNLVNYQTFSSSTNWTPYYVPQYEVPNVSPYDTYVWRSAEPDAASNWTDFSIPNGDNVYGGYQASWSYSIHIENPRRVSAVRYLSLQEVMNEDDNPPRHSTNLPYHLEDEVLVLHMFPPPTPHEIWSVTEDLRNHTYIPFHLQDDVIILDMSLPPTDYEDFHSHPNPVNVDMSDETIEKYLKKKTYVSSTNRSKEASSLDDDFDICVVCQAEYENKEEICSLRCGHGYHVDCIKKWLRKKNECPMCRDAILELEN